MKITYNWLKDFVEIKISPEALAEKLTMAGLEVTSQEKKGGDFVFEIEVTPNRPDCLSVIGIAREVAAITGKKLKLPKLVYSPQTTVHSQRKNKKLYGLSTMDYRLFSIKIENKKDCLLYTAKIIKDVQVGPSPEWLKKRLELIGCRSVNNIVDITNYILFEWGEPLHAFDLDKLALGFGSSVFGQKIIIRRAKKGEEIITIDGIKRALDEGLLIIASDACAMTGDRRQATGRPVALAGIMGGKDTEVTENTKNILLEAAIFNPIVIRRSRQKLGLQTDSSYRFERGIDLERAGFASWQAAQLIQDVARGRCILAKGLPLRKPKKKSINLDASFASKILGVNIGVAKIRQILNALGFKVKLRSRASTALTIEVPSFRQDVNLETDLIEELARIYGYEKIPKSLPAVLPQGSSSQKRELVSLIKNILAGLGLNEVITYSLIDKELLRRWQGASPVEILNPLSKEQEVLRPALLPSLSRVVSLNLNQQQGYINIFESALAFSERNGQPKEELRLGIALCGVKSLLLTEGLIKEEAGFLHLKGILEALFARLGIIDYHFTPLETIGRQRKDLVSLTGFTSGQDNTVSIYVKEENIGEMLRLGREVLGYLDIKNKDVFMLEISLDRLLPYADLNKKFMRLPVYPGVSRDISLILKEEVLAGDILKAVQERGGPLLAEAKIIDCYKGRQIPPGFKGLTISCLYRSDKRTLTEEEVAPIHSGISPLLMERFQAQIR